MLMTCMNPLVRTSVKLRCRNAQSVRAVRAYSIKTIGKKLTGGDDDDSHQDFRVINRDLETNVRILDRIFDIPTLDSHALMDIMEKRWGKLFELNLITTTSDKVICLEVHWKHHGLEEFSFDHIDDYRKHLDDIGYILTINGFVNEVHDRFKTTEDTPYALMGSFKNSLRFTFKKDYPLL